MSEVLGLEVTWVIPRDSHPGSERPNDPVWPPGCPLPRIGEQVFFADLPTLKVAAIAWYLDPAYPPAVLIMTELEGSQDAD